MKKPVTIFFCFLLFCGQGRAAEESKADHIGAKLLAAQQATGKLPALDMGLAVTLDEGWYTYWRMPGDNGLAPVFDWKNSVNVKDVAIAWPAPSRFTMADMHSFGYSGKILLPLTVTPVQAGKDVTVSLKFDTVVCHDICVPQTLFVSKKIAAGNAVQTADFATIEKAKKSLPADKNTKTLGMDTAILSKDAVVVTAYSKDGFSNGADLIVQTEHSILTAPPEIIHDESDKTRAIFKIKPSSGIDLSKELFGKDVSIILIEKNESVERKFSF